MGGAAAAAMNNLSQRFEVPDMHAVLAVHAPLLMVCVWVMLPACLPAGRAARAGSTSTPPAALCG